MKQAKTDAPKKGGAEALDENKLYTYNEDEQMR
jgi:hypothetical protein